MPDTQLPVCPKCGKPAPVLEAPFCAYCGAPMRAVSTPVIPDGAKAALKKAENETDPRKKHALLIQAEKDYPDCLEIAQELLFLGRLHERNPRNPDYSVIKCHLLHMYLTPNDFAPQKCDEMRTELFEHPQLKRCQALSADGQAYLHTYLERLCVEFVQLFLLGSNHYMRSIMGISLGGRAAKLLADPVSCMMCNIQADEELTPAQRQTLYAALYRAFVKQVSGESKYVDDALQARDCPIPVGA